MNVLQKTSLEVLNPAELLELEVSLEQVSNKWIFEANIPSFEICM
jgi:hypothetical protein